MSMILLLFYLGIAFVFGCNDCQKPKQSVGSYYTPIKECYSVNETVLYSCYYTNFYKRGSEKHTCLKNGTWSGSLFYCDCHKPKRSAESNYVPMKQSYGVNEEVKYYCYDNSRSATSTCLANGTWSGSLFYCGCQKPPAPPFNGGLVLPPQDFYNINDTINYYCLSGKRYLIGSSSRMCQENGTWSQSLPYCALRTTTTLLSRIEDREILLDGRNDTCIHSHENDEKVQIQVSGLHKTIVVQIIATYKYDPRQCKKFDVRIYRHHSWIKLQANIFPLRYVYLYSKEMVNPVIEITLNENHGCYICEVIVFSDTISSCLWPENPNNATTITFDTIPQKNFQYGDAAVYDCIEGYRLVGDQVRYCDEDGKWTGSDTYCEAITCSQNLPIIRNGNWLMWGNETRYSVNYTVEGACKSGYTNNGKPVTVTCNSLGFWSLSVIECQRETITCLHPPPTINNGFWPNWENSTRYSFNYTMEGVCKPGYTNHGKPHAVTCSSEGSWFPLVFEAHCQEKSVSSMQGNLLGRVAVISITVVGLLMILVCICICIALSRRRLAKKYHKRMHQRLLKNPIYNGGESNHMTEGSHEATKKELFQSRNPIFEIETSTNQEDIEDDYIYYEPQMDGRCNVERISNEQYFKECPIAKPMHQNNIPEPKGLNKNNKYSLQLQPPIERIKQDKLVENEFYSTD